MKFNYQTEKKKFDEAWEETESTCRKYGMQEEKIQELKAYDWDEFKRERIFCIHNQHFPNPPKEMDDEMELESKNPLYEKFIEACSVLMPAINSEDRQGWMDDISDERIWEAIQMMNDLDLELITLLIFEEYTQKEIAEKWGISPVAVNRRYQKIRKKFEKVFRKA